VRILYDCIIKKVIDMRYPKTSEVQEQSDGDLVEANDPKRSLKAFITHQVHVCEGRKVVSGVQKVLHWCSYLAGAD